MLQGFFGFFLNFAYSLYKNKKESGGKIPARFVRHIKLYDSNIGRKLVEELERTHCGKRPPSPEKKAPRRTTDWEILCAFCSQAENATTFA